LMSVGEMFATHIVGGGMTYECLGNSGNGLRYRFTMKVYVDCLNGNVGFDDPANIAIYQGTEQVNFFFNVSTVPLGSFQNINANEPDCIDNLPDICLREGIYTWEQILPLSTQSYFIEYQRCCRTNAITNIINPSGSGATYFVEITPAAQQLCNSSPVFNNFPPVVVCNNYPLEVDYSVTDPDGDQLVYSFCAPFSGGGQFGNGCNTPAPFPPCPPPFDPIIFTAPNYTAGAPMGGNPVVQIDPQTGVISGTPQLNGQYVVGVCVEEYRNGQLLSVTRRDFQFNVAPCLPQVTALVEYDEIAGPQQYVIKKCDGSTQVTIVNQSFSSDTIQSFKWIFDLNNDNTLQDSINFDLAVNFPGLGIYNGMLVLNEGLDCGDTAFVRVELYPPASLDLGPDFTICQDSNLVFNAGSGFASYMWQDGTTAQTFSATSIGVYHVIVTDHCGNVQKDSVFVTGGMAPPINFSNVGICLGDSVKYTVTGDFAQIDWTPTTGATCTNCSTVTFQPTVSTLYTVVATTQNGCTATETVHVEVEPIPMQTYVIQFYPNQSVTIGGQTYTQPTTVTIPVPSSTGIGCDSLNTYILELIPTTLDLQCPANLTVGLPNNATTVPVNYAMPAATTDCPGTPSTINLTQGLPSGGNFPAGLNTICYEASNTCSNQDNCCFTVMVTTLDLLCPPNMTVAMPNNAATTVVNYPLPTATTDCPGANPSIQLIQGIPSGGSFSAGVNTICYEATNTCGNSKSCCFTATITTLDINCPASQTVQLPVAAATVAVSYAAPTSTTNCSGSAATISLLDGLPSGSAFPLGINQICYEGSNTCGNRDTCCFNVTVLEPPSPCDIKTIGCMKYELLDIRLDSIKQPRFRIRVTNFCASEMDYAMIELPHGIVAITPQNGSTYTAPNTGNEYLVHNPNASPFYSTRYRSVGVGINNGQFDVLEQRLPQQSFPNNYIHMNAKLKNGQSFEAYLNTFYCPVQPWAGSKQAEGLERQEDVFESSTFSIRPNPTDGLLFVDLSQWQGQSAQIQVLNAQGQVVKNQICAAGNEWLELNLDDTLANGLYYLMVQPEGGKKVATKFVLAR
ncbi:MAG: HYR domain-containing protein, partial [Saprospiraceae bacterium]|nr:HYR domain-containing protein [Saprospiraceae bacterium]